MEVAGRLRMGWRGLTELDYSVAESMTSGVMHEVKQAGCVKLSSGVVSLRPWQLGTLNGPSGAGPSHSGRSRGRLWYSD